MTWKNAHAPLLGGIGEQLLRHSQGEISVQATLLRQERQAERLRIARELHDTLLQGFLSASLHLCLADKWVPADSPAKPALQRALHLMRKGIDEGRNALAGLRSRPLPEGSLEKALCDSRNDFVPNEQARLKIVVLGETQWLSPAVQEQIFLIAREALLNALRHSQASRVEAEIEYLRGKLRVAVRDNGTGIDPQVLRSGRSSHWGLMIMRERAASIGAKLRIWSKKKGGTEVEISVPIRGKRATQNLDA